MPKEARATEDAVTRWVEDLKRGIQPEINSRRIFERYYGWVLRFFLRRGLLHHRAEELAQDVLFQALSKIDSFREDASFDSWLFAIAANSLRNEKRWRSRKKRDGPEVSMDSANRSDMDPVELITKTESPAKARFEAQRMEALDQAIDRLSERPKQCIRLRLKGYDYTEIAELLRMSPSTVRVHVATSKKRLEKELGDTFGPWID